MIDNQDSKLLFYKIMDYPVPLYKDSFFHTEKKTEIEEEIQYGQKSWDEISGLTKEYIDYIYKWSGLFKSIPFIETIYLCNSLSFNKINEESDIDIFIITKKKALWRARFFSVFFFRVLGLKRSMTNKKKKFCLSFYVTEDHQNLYNISLANTDIYLAYWIAHLIPIYEAKKGNANIYANNTWIQSILPNIQSQQNIFLDIPVTQGNNKIKKILEWGHTSIIGKIIEKIIKTIRLPIIIYKVKKLKGIGEDIIINNDMLKFYADQRKKIALLYKVSKDKLLSNKSEG